MPLHDLGIAYYLAFFLSSPSTVATVAALGLLAVVVAFAARRRRLLVLATGVSAAVIGGLTLAPARGWSTLTVLLDPVAAVRTALHPSVDDRWAWGVADGPANVVLFVPFAFCCGLLLRRPGAAFTISVVGSVIIESYQAATGTRVGTFADIVANGVGALIGAVLATLVLLVVSGSRRLAAWGARRSVTSSASGWLDPRHRRQPSRHLGGGLDLRVPRKLRMPG